MNLLLELRSRFETVLATLCDDPAPYATMVKPAQDARFGDYQANCAMPLAKQQGTNPRELAAKIIAGLQVDDLCEPPEIAGPGFINLTLRPEWLTAAVTGLVADDRLGVPFVAQPKNVIVDYSSPNVAKPMHVGHLRSSVIGDALYRILSFLGHRVTGDNHLGDWGTQFGMIIYGFKNFLNVDAFDNNAVGELARLYRLVNQLSDYHEAKAGLPALKGQLSQLRQEQSTLEAGPQPTDKREQDQRNKQVKKLATTAAGLQDQISSAERKIAAVDDDPELQAMAEAHPKITVLAREETAKLHAGDVENRRLWELFMPHCQQAIQKIYDRLDVHFDLSLGESFYQPLLAEVTQNLQTQGLARESDGALCVFIDGFEAPFIIRKSDGAYTYATTDLATIKYRVEELQADVLVYVVDARQGDHFKLLFETARNWGIDNWGHGRIELQHVSFGTILGDDKRPFKTRSGDSVGLESLLDESIVQARKIVDASDDGKPAGAELDEAARTRIAEAVGLGAIKYADLSQNRESDYVFSWEKMLATHGDTATYMQYAYARVCGIFRKGNVDREALRAAGGQVLLTTPAERALALQLLRFAEVLHQTAAEYRPNFLTNYLFETANSFSAFFEHCPVLKAETDELRTSRLLLADLTARVLAQGLQLLGIRTMEQM